MFRKVETWVDVVALEHQTQKFWDEHQCFEELRRKNAKGPRWSFLDGPITANNPMGVHHAWGRTLKDVYQRYHAMLGCALRYQNGFDCQGLWVEVEVEKELGFKSKTDIEQYGIARFVEKCKERVRKFSGVQSDQSKRLGYWMDWNDSYYTMADENNYTIWHFLKKCHDRGLVYLGHDVMPWCPRCGTGVSQHEMHEGYKDVAHKSVIVRFPIRGRTGESLLVWTTTPWTLTSNVAAAVHPDLTYAKVRQGEHVLYLAEALCPKVLKNAGPYEVLSTLKGRDLLGLAYDGPFDELGAQQKESRHQHKVIPWDAVSESDGTGIVHIAPGCGAEDFQLGKEHALAALCPIDEMGMFTAGYEPFTGTSAYEVAPAVFASLKAKGVMYSIESYQHSYPHCWRCSSELLFRLVDEWFIKMDPWRQEIMEVAKQINWIPAYGRELELDWLKNMRDWMISKKRYWGLALPIWRCSDPACGWFDVVGSKEELERRALRGWSEMEGKSPHRPQVDAVVLRCPTCGKDAFRVKDVGNPWLDAGIVPYSTMGYNTNRAYWEQWFPAALVLECFPGQFRNWFYAMLAMSTMMENRAPFKTLLGHALVKDEKGEEMHKSKGNAIWFDEAVEKIGADVMRWIYCSQDPTQNLNFGYGPAREVRGKFYNTLWNSYAFFVNYARLAEWKPGAETVPFERRPDMDRWILSHLQKLLAQAPKAYEELRVHHLVRDAEAFVERLSNWYIRQNRRRFWKNATEEDARAALDTLYRCLEGLNRALAPLIPHTAEEIYQNLVRANDESAPVSVHHTAFPEAQPGWVDEVILAEMDAAQRLTWMGLSAREAAGQKVRQPLPEFIVQPRDDDERRGALRFHDLLAETLNVKKLTVLPEGKVLSVDYKVALDFAKLGPKLGPRMKAAGEAFKALDTSAVVALVKAGTSLNLKAGNDTVTIAPDEIKLQEITPKHLRYAEDGKTRVAIDTTVTPELAREGLMRDLLRHLQTLRKDVGLEIEDRIDVLFHTDSPALRDMLAHWSDHVRRELLCLSWTDAPTPGEGWHEVKIEKEQALVSIARSTASAAASAATATATATATTPSDPASKPKASSGGGGSFGIPTIELK